VLSERKPGAWIIEVADNGVGIHPDHHETIFGVFKRLHTRDVEGTGIGLAIVKRIVEHYRGRVWVESRPGEGSRFKVLIPHSES
jgi:signal transduction histidine kinase